MGAFRQVTDAVQAGLDDPAVAGREFDSPMGPQTFEGAVSQFLCGDLVVHQWDLARATGQDETLDARRGPRHARRPPARWTTSSAARASSARRSSRRADADEQTAFLCFLGRQV